jgi:uncharacterized protein (TIGR03067 family)
LGDPAAASSSLPSHRAATIACSLHNFHRIDAMIDGTWVPNKAVMGGQPFPEPVLTMMQLTVAGGAYVVSVGGQLDKGTVTLDTASRPMGMTITGVEGPNIGKAYPAIFEINGDAVTICYDLSGQARPTAFESPAGSMHFLVEYRRAES